MPNLGVAVSKERGEKKGSALRLSLAFGQTPRLDLSQFTGSFGATDRFGFDAPINATLQPNV